MPHRKYVHIFKCVSLRIIFSSCFALNVHEEGGMEKNNIQLRDTSIKHSTAQHTEKLRESTEIGTNTNTRVVVTEGTECVTWRFVVRQQHNVLLLLCLYITLCVASRGFQTTEEGSCSMKISLLASALVFVSPVFMLPAFPPPLFSSLLFVFSVCFVNSPKRKWRTELLLPVCPGRFSYCYTHFLLSVDVGCLCVVALLILFGAVDIFSCIFFILRDFFFSSCDIFTTHDIFLEKKQKKNKTT